MMTAFEALTTSIDLRMGSVMEVIQEAVRRGELDTRWYSSEDEVLTGLAQRLARNGYDVKLNLVSNTRYDNDESFIEISWARAQEGREGTITTITKIKNSYSYGC